MNKKEQILRKILHEAIDQKRFDFTQKGISEKLGVSLSTVFNALKVPRMQGAIKVSGRDFSVIDTEKLLYIWATQRNIEKDIIYRTFVPASAKEIEGAMPAGAIFAAYSAYAQKYGSAPADYDQVYVYADSHTLMEIKKRFAARKGNPNLFVLKSDPLLEAFGLTAPDAQIFCDLWNLREWYAKDFLKSLKEKIFPL